MQKSGAFAMCVATVERRSFNVKSVHTFLVGFYLERKLETNSVSKCDSVDRLSGWRQKRSMRITGTNTKGDLGNYSVSSTVSSFPSGRLIPNFSSRYCSVRKVSPRSFAALVML